MTKNFRQIVLPLIVALIWGSAFIVQGAVADKMGPFTFNGVRSLIAVVALTVTALIFDGVKKKKGVTVEKTNVKMLVVGGVLCGIALTVASNLQQFGMFGTTKEAGEVLTEGDTAFITALYIVLVPLSLLFFGKKPTLNVWIAVVVAVVGLMLICNFTGGKAFSVYHLELFLCSAAFTVHILLIDHFVKFVDGVKLSCVQFSVMGVSSLILALIFEDFTFKVVFDNILPLLYVGVFSCAIAYTLQIVAQKGTNPTIVSILLSLESFFALVCEIGVGLISGNVKQHTVWQIVGCALMLIAIVLAQVNVFEMAKKQKE